MWLFRYTCISQWGEMYWKLIYMFGFILLSSLQYVVTLSRLVTSSRTFCSVRVYFVIIIIIITQSRTSIIPPPVIPIFQFKDSFPLTLLFSIVLH